MSDETPKKEGQVDDSRRNFFKLGLAGAGVAAAAAGGGFVLKAMEGKEHDDLYVPVDKKLFKPFDQRKSMLSYALSGVDPELLELGMGFEKGPYRNAPGYTQLDRALAEGGWSVSMYMAPYQQMGQPNMGSQSWKQDHLRDHQYGFESRQAAAAAIKAAGKLYGAVMVGICRNDPRFNYTPIYDIQKKKALSWEKDFPFKPKSVIVMACEMNYEAIATAPAWTESAAAATVYSECVKTAYQMAIFMRTLGFKAVPAVNDLGSSVGYGIMAGLGEGARNGTLIVPEYGPRVRLCKVYTDFDFVEYDKPRSFGVESFCRHCKKCAMACPSQTISMDDEPSFHPTYSDNPKDWLINHVGFRKWYSDSEKCFRFWCKNDGDCGICIAACPYNKPAFWHHRLVDAQNVISPGPVHEIMRVMDDVFGYGKVDDPAKIKKWWKYGPPKGKIYGTKA